MGRRITNGLTGNVGSSISSLSVVDNALITVIPNQNIVLDPNGTGKVTTDATIHVTATTASTNANTGALQVDGGVGINGDMHLGGVFADASGFETFGTGTSHMTIPQGTSAQRPNSPSEGWIRFNTDINSMEQYNGSSWVPAGGFNSVSVSSNRTSAAYENNFVNTASGGITVTLPSSANMGDEVRFFDVAKTFDSNALTVARNGHLIMGDAANLTVTTEGAAFSLVYFNSTYGWRILTI